MSHTQSGQNDIAAGHDGSSQIEPDDIGVGLLAVIGTMIAVLIVLVSVLLQAWFYNWQGEMLATRAAPVEVQKLPAEIAKAQQARIELRDPATRSIPIGQAMRLVVKELGGELPEEGGGR